MKFGNFLFPDCRDPARDGAVIDETLAEARLSDELGIDVIWLAEHHFDGISVYADPIALAGALAASLRHAAIGFAVLQTALHHPIRLAEQMALLDHLTKGRRVGLYRQAMLDAGYDEAAIAANLGASWAWRNVFVAASDAEAERIGIAAFETMTRARAEMRNRIFADTGMRIEVPQSDLPGSRATRGDGLIYGAPAKVTEDFAALNRLGIGGVIASFRLGPMPHEVAVESLDLFMREVAPHL